MIRILPLLAVLAASAAPLAAQTSSGTIWFVSGKGEGSKQDTIVQMWKPGVLRMEMSDAQARGAGYMIVDSKAQTMTYVMTGEKMYMTRPFPKLGPNATSDMGELTVTETGRTETIAGVSCRVYEGSRTDKDGKVHKGEACLAKGVGFQLADVLMTMMKNSGAGGSFYNTMKKFKDQDLHALKWTDLTDGKANETFVAIKIDRTPPPESAFQPPSGFTKMDMPANIPLKTP
jgi:hypothetical protein